MKLNCKWEKDENSELNYGPSLILKNKEDYI
jgi:hypothetical protein